MTFTEDSLINNIKSCDFKGTYYLYGEELFLTETYTKKIISKAVCDNMNDINIIKLNGSELSVDTLYDTTDSFPMFAERKAVLINELDCEKLSDEDNEKLFDILKNVPSHCVVIISQTGFVINAKKTASKKLITMLSKEKNAAVCEFKAMNAAKVAELIIKKAAKNGCVISRANANKLAELTLCNLTLCSNETEKLCCYAQSGEITSEMIDSLVNRQLDTSIFALANAIAKNDRKSAFNVLDELFIQRIEPSAILPSLSSAYLDFYRAAVALHCGKSPETVAADFGYPKNRSFVVSKAFSAVSRLPLTQIRKSITILSEADMKLKTSGGQNARTVLEQTIVMLFAQKRK